MNHSPHKLSQLALKANMEIVLNIKISVEVVLRPLWPAAMRESLGVYVEKLMQHISKLPNEHTSVTSKLFLSFLVYLLFGPLGVESPTEGLLGGAVFGEDTNTWNHS